LDIADVSFGKCGGAVNGEVPLASGFIAGEAIIAVIIPLLVVLGIVH
jgi:hypothetical protein